jgi:hypothetical protein
MKNLTGRQLQNIYTTSPSQNGWDVDEHNELMDLIEEAAHNLGISGPLADSPGPQEWRRIAAALKIPACPFGTSQETPRTYRYFVSYSFTAHSSEYGFGNQILTMTTPIAGIDEIRKITASITSTDPELAQVVISNYVLIEN